MTMDTGSYEPLNLQSDGLKFDKGLRAQMWVTRMKVLTLEKIMSQRLTRERI